MGLMYEQQAVFEKLTLSNWKSFTVVINFQ